MQRFLYALKALPIITPADLFRAIMAFTQGPVLTLGGDHGETGRLGAQMVQVELPYLIANLNERHIEEGSVLCQKIRIIRQLVLFL